MPKAKKKAGFKVNESDIRISAKRTSIRRETADRRRNSNPGDVFWAKVINGFENFLKSPWSK